MVVYLFLIFLQLIYYKLYPDATVFAAPGPAGFDHALKRLRAFLGKLFAFWLTSEIDCISNGHNMGFIRGYEGHVDSAETYQILNKAFTAANELITSPKMRRYAEAANKIPEITPQNSFVW